MFLRCKNLRLILSKLNTKNIQSYRLHWKVLLDKLSNLKINKSILLLNISFFIILYYKNILIISFFAYVYNTFKILCVNNNAAVM